MIGYLNGKIFHQSESGTSCQWIVLVESVGYEVQVPKSAKYVGMKPGTPVSVYVHTHVREDALQLFGFLSLVDREIFQTLIQMSGIGPKLALSVLSGMDVDELIPALMNRDIDALTRIPGIGKKTAERMMVELGDLVGKKVSSGALPRASGASAHPDLTEARSALLSLGYREADFSRILSDLTASGEARDVENLIRSTLQRLAK
jgi:Holliday junction DNA helicase RuvA